MYEMYPFEVMGTFRLPCRSRSPDAYQLIKKHILLPIADYLKTQIAAHIVIILQDGDTSAHAHALILSKDQSLFSRCSEVLAHLQSRKSPLNTHSDAIHLRPKLDIGGSQYVAKNVSDDAAFHYYNLRLLADTKTKE